MSQIINHQAVIVMLKERMLHEMEEAAKPLIEEYAKKINEELRKRVAAFALSTLDVDYNVCLNQTDLVITIRNHTK